MGARLVATVVEPDRNYGHAGVTTKKQRFTYFQKVYGHGRWRKLKGIAFVKLPKKNLLHNAAAISLIIAGSSLQLYSSDKETR